MLAGSSSDSQASTARTSSTHISAARTSSAHVSAPSITSPPASSSNQTTMIGTAGAPAADPLVVRNTLHCPQAAICSCQRKQVRPQTVMHTLLSSEVFTMCCPS